MKICPSRSELFHADGQTDGWTDRQAGSQKDVMKPIVDFRNFANAPKSIL